MNALHMNHPSESLVLIPHMMGFKPRNCVVLLALASERADNMSGPLGRIELNGTAMPPTLAHDVLDFINDYSVTTLVLAWFGDDLSEMIASEGAQIVHDAALIAQEFLDDRYRSESTGFVTCLLTDYRSWIDGRSLESHPSFGQLGALGLVERYEAIENSNLATELVFAGSAPLDIEPEHVWSRVGRRARAVAIDSFEQAKGRVRGALIWRNTLADLPPAGTVMAHNACVILGGKRRIGKLNAALQDLFIRDLVLLWGIHPQVGDLTSITPCQADDLLADAASYRVDLDRVDALIDVLSACASYSADDDGAAYAVVAYLYWWKGEGYKALANAQASLEADPKHALAQLIRRAVCVHLPPPWFAVESAA